MLSVAVLLGRLHNNDHGEDKNEGRGGGHANVRDGDSRRYNAEEMLRTRHRELLEALRSRC